MPLDLGGIDWKVVGGAVSGGAAWKLCSLAYQWWDRRHGHQIESQRLELDREVAQDAVQAEFRDELRAELKRVRDDARVESAEFRKRIEGLEQDVLQWRRSYDRAVEEREEGRTRERDLNQLVQDLTDELHAANDKIAILESQVQDLQAAMPLGRGGATP